MSFSNSLIGDLAVAGVDPANQRRLFLTGALEAEISEQFCITGRRVAECLRRSAGVGAGHICYAVMDHVFLDIDRVLVCRGPRSLGATALVDGNIHKDA